MIDAVKLSSQVSNSMYKIDGKPAGIRAVRTRARDDVLKASLGPYLTAREIREATGTSPSRLATWRKAGRIRARKIKGAWYYSKEDVINTMRTAG